MSDTAAATELATTPDERSMATLAHVLQLVGGFIAPLIIFFVRRESRFVSFHALQVLFLQILNILLNMVFMVALFGLIFGGMAAQGGPSHGAPPVVFFLVFPFFWLFMMLTWVGILALAIVFGIKAGRGEWANYPFLGKLARRVLNL